MKKDNLSAYLLNTPSKDKWERIGLKKRAGVLVPLFSVYSRRSLGIGELEDLKLLIDWCQKTGNSILQLLPMNEVGLTFCPYDSLSSFALEPAYLSLEKITSLNKNPLRDKVKKLRKEFPVGRSHVDYRIKKEKLNLLRDIYLEFRPDNQEAFKKFQAENSYWLDDFALFKALKDNFGGRPWYEWEDKYKRRDQAALLEFRRVHEREIAFQIWIQWQLFKQFKEIKEYAQAKKVLLKGDLPILVSRDSADVWVHPEFFKLEFAAGAPPDMYCAKGQRWGVSTYNWERIASDGYKYLKARLRHAEEFYDILRIDHVVGLFRIWSIPYGESEENQGLHGFFDPQDEHKWEAGGRNLLLQMLKDTKMLLCAEDLGVIPKSCRETLEKLGIPGTDVQRWTKDWKVRHDFLPLDEYRVLSVAILSVHDSTNWAAWWENEAGTLDEELFRRRCRDRGIDFERIKDKLFAAALSRRGRLRWSESVTSVETLVNILGKRKEELNDFIEFYQNSYREKEKLWLSLNLKGPLRENADAEIITAALKMVLASQAIFSIQLIVDWLYPGGIFRGDSYQYRINKPGTISADNWSLVVPIALEDLLRHKVCRQIRMMIASSSRLK